MELFITSQNFKASFSKKFFEILKTQNFPENKLILSFNNYYRQYFNILRNSMIKTQVNFKNELIKYLKTKNNRLNCSYRKNLHGNNFFEISNSLETLSKKV
jgi:hypothetical protein